MSYTQLSLFALNATRHFGEQVARHMDITLGTHEEREFEDGEHKSRPLESVEGKDVYVIQSLYGDMDQSVNDKLCRLLFFIGALKDAGAAQLTAVVPYLCYARKDKKTNPRDPVTTRYVSQMFEAAGIDRVVTMDVHNIAAYQNAFRCRTEHLEGSDLMAAHFSTLPNQPDYVAVSPDLGGIQRMEKLAKTLGKLLGYPVPTAVMEKQRSGEKVSGDKLYGDVAGKTAIIIDDLISTGTTIARTVAACQHAGAARIHAAATHGLFVGEAQRLLSHPTLEKLVITNTIPPFRLEEVRVKSKLVILDAAALFAEAIRRLHI